MKRIMFCCHLMVLVLSCQQKETQLEPANQQAEKKSAIAFSKAGLMPDEPSFVFFAKGKTPQETNSLNQSQLQFLEANGLTSAFTYDSWVKSNSTTHVLEGYKRNCALLKGHPFYKTYVQQGGYLLLNKLRLLDSGSQNDIEFITQILVENEYNGMHVLCAALQKLQTMGAADFVAGAKAMIRKYYNPDKSKEIEELEQLAETAKGPTMERAFRQAIANIEENNAYFTSLLQL